MDMRSAPQERSNRLSPNNLKRVKQYAKDRQDTLDYQAELRAYAKGETNEVADVDSSIVND